MSTHPKEPPATIFLNEVAALFEKYLTDEGYKFYKENRHMPFGLLLTEIAFYVYPVDFPEDRATPGTEVVLNSNGRIDYGAVFYDEGQLTHKQHYWTNVHEPDAFLKIKKFLDEVFK